MMVTASTSRYSLRSSQKWAAWAPFSFKPAGKSADIIHTYYTKRRASSLRYPPSVSQKDNPINAKQDTILMLLNIHFFFECQNFTSDTQLRMMLFVKTEHRKMEISFTRKKRMC